MIRWIIVSLFILLERSQARDCGIPPNLAEFPDFAREEIKEIWRNYVPGTVCQRELDIEKDILDVIKTFDSDASNNSSPKKQEVVSTKIRREEDYDQIASNGGTPIPLLSPAPNSINNVQRSVSDLSIGDDYIDQTTFDDVAMMQFDHVKAPFLRTVSNSVRREFEKVWNDDNIPSESLRSLKIQTLAVSLLTGKQLSEYNRWATKRRRVLKAREQEMRGLSFDAKQTLRKMSSLKARDPGEQLTVPIEVKKELSTFVRKLNRRRNLKLVH
ncbi:unnamed protein product [Caenorhabditis angaria]|uniref:Uncharacterized protein n=1 Tax=Caenorhabditis angaria TaxID=860376 RepID=A0A9P1J494_9PELO|nr:unnamed protein product [Caenorhabditis angaria]